MAREAIDTNVYFEFFDPEKINGEAIKRWPEVAENWVVEAMLAQLDNEYIFLPYNPE